MQAYVQNIAATGSGNNVAQPLKAVHETIGTVGGFLIGAHALAALFHHCITRNTMRLRMLPGKA